MKIDPLQAGTKIDLLPLENKPKEKAPQPSLAVEQIKPAAVKGHAAAAPSALPEPERVTVSVDASRELVYRFVDVKTGEVTSQTPPEQVLAVVRGIQDLLRAEERTKIPGVNVRG
jgi:predicted Zn-dependent protease